MEEQNINNQDNDQIGDGQNGEDGNEILDDDSRIFIPSDDMIIDKCTFSNISSSSNEGLFILTLIQHLNIFLKA